ncbi:unnamed protein product (macronuclear) [Paramecium tetraurelia]|uniref:PPM-type phosphatase domain-containing protein n=1 Tax=Paramecium tetraurelia TaxID=5888 RepID=A0BTR9_PARTE|nr:uncharacterized protein GSPATT00032168001 [Paramecium tetraurelia]CAK61936.1 unnamed protein product [Paramecium tetraurelia]|eukprot:XP_001429334.1 hypothetical protein (macronuclear) [Paramecium tetraurelia strain d4-2]
MMDLEIVIDHEYKDFAVQELIEQFDEFEQQTEKYHLYMNRGFRREMLDRYQILNNHYAIFDGHGSSHVADYLTQNLLQKIQNEMSDQDYKQLFKETDSNLSQYTQSGSVAILLSIQNKTVTITNLGDCKAVVFREDSHQQLNSIHIPQSKEENQRIHKQGGLITKRQNICRVSGQLTVTRSFGDFHLKKFVISEPEISKYQIKDNDRYIVMASDGFWNELSETAIQQILQKVDPSKNVAKQLYQSIENDYIRDNVTIMVFPL